MTLKPLPTFREQVSKTNANLLAGTSRSDIAWLCLLQLAAHIPTIFRELNFSQNFGITCKISRAIRVSSSAICSHLCRANPGPVNSRHCPVNSRYSRNARRNTVKSILIAKPRSFLHEQNVAKYGDSVMPFSGRKIQFDT